jgi:hypothetical protein
MIASAVRSPEPGFDLPPAFSWIAPPAGIAVHDFASRIAPQLGAGTLTSRAGETVLELAVVLEPEEPLREARRAILTCMAALAAAIGACAPPEKPVTLIYPDVIAFDAARLGGGRLAWPDGCGDDDVPDWLVFSAMLIASKAHAGDPGLTPDSTALDEEGFEPGAPDAMVEAFARYLLLAFDDLRDRGFAASSEAYRRWIPDGRDAALDAGGNLRTPKGDVLQLAPALAATSWLDPATGAPRL